MLLAMSDVFNIVNTSSLHFIINMKNVSGPSRGDVNLSRENSNIIVKYLVNQSHVVVDGDNDGDVKHLLFPMNLFLFLIRLI